MNVENLMSKKVLTCFASDTLEVPAKLMWEGDVGAVVVLDRDSGKVAGFVTDRDICMAAYTTGKPLSALIVDGPMAHEVHTLKPKDTIVAAEELLRQKRIRRSPVVDATGKLVGILSLNDIAREANRERGARSQEIPPAELVSTYAAICEPRRQALPARPS